MSEGIAMLSKIRFGVALPQGWSYDLSGTASTADLQQRVKNQQASMEYEFSKNISKAVDQSSRFDSIYTYDHFLPYYAPNNTNDFFEYFTLLSAVAATTSKVKLGQVVACNSYRNPALLAKMVSTLDIISNGRVELGIGDQSFKDAHPKAPKDPPPCIMSMFSTFLTVDLVDEIPVRPESCFTLSFDNTISKSSVTMNQYWN